jgi:hypothetical protein
MVERIARAAQEARDRRDRLADATEALGKGIVAQAGAKWRNRRVSQCRADQRAPVVTLGARTEEHFRIIRYEATKPKSTSAVLRTSWTASRSFCVLNDPSWEQCLWPAECSKPACGPRRASTQH